MPTSYVRDMMGGAASGGLDDSLRQLAKDDAELLEHLGVSDERQRNLAFYLDLFLDELCGELGMPVPSDRRAVLAKAFSELRGAKDADLSDIRSALYRAMGGKRTKRAYPNISGVMETNMKPRRDVDKWVKTLGEIHAAERVGANRENAFRNLTEEWDPVEKLDFQQWLRYYERGDHEKYASAPEVAPAPADQQPVAPRRRLGPESRSIEENRKSLIGRLDAAKRLLRFFAPPVWPQERWNSIYRALADLEQEIIGLRTTASMRDRIIRTAAILDKAGFGDGAKTLLRIAQPPDEDVASQIEKALTGKEYQIKPSGGDLPPMPPGGDLSPMPPGGDLSPMPPTGGEGVPPAGEAGAPPPEGGMPPEAMGTLPEPPPPPTPAPEPEPPKDEGKKPAKDENPYADATANDILDILEPLMKRFKEREVVRQLSKADMMMDALNIVSYFPELGEAVGRLIETDSYVGTRLEKIIGKLRGGLRDDGGKGEKGKGKSEKAAPPSIDMGPAPTEETAVSVSEKRPEAVPAPAAPVEETAVTVGEKPAPPPTTAPGV